MAKRKKKLKQKEISHNLIEEELGSFEEIENDPTYQKLNHRQKKLLHLIFLQPLTHQTNTEMYIQAYGRTVQHPIKKKHTPRSYHQNITYACYNSVANSVRMKPLIKKIKQMYQRRFRVTEERILQEEASIAFSDILKYTDENGHLIKPPSQLPRYIRAAIKSYDRIVSQNKITYKVTLWNKGAALQRLQSMFDMNAAKKIEIKNTTNTNYDFNLLTYDEKQTLKTLLNKARVENMINVTPDTNRIMDISR